MRKEKGEKGRKSFTGVENNIVTEPTYPELLASNKQFKLKLAEARIAAARGNMPAWVVWDVMRLSLRLRALLAHALWEMDQFAPESRQLMVKNIRETYNDICIELGLDKESE